VARLGGKPVKTGRYPVVLAPEVAAGFFGHLVGAISGGNLYRRSSFLLDALGQTVLPPHISIQEDPLLPQGLASAPFDSEGVGTQARTIVAEGVLQTYLLASYAARKLNMTPTGHAGGIYNWQVSHSEKTQADMLRDMDTGLLITEVMGQGVNLVTGDYSRGAAGFWVENGHIVAPVSEITLAGNLRDMLMGIQTVGADVDIRYQIRSGSVLLDAVQVAGS
jgi:PmbA protein